MTTSDSGVIDLFAIHKEEEARQAAVAMPSTAPPAVAMDVRVSESDIDAFSADAQKSRRRTKLIGGAVGGMVVLAVVLGAIALGGKEETKTAAASVVEPPPPAATAPPPAAPPAPVVATPAPSGSASGKPDYTPATASAAYIAQQKGKTAGQKFAVGKPIPKAGGPKMQKIQSSGTGN